MLSLFALCCLCFMHKPQLFLNHIYDSIPFTVLMSHIYFWFFLILLLPWAVINEVGTIVPKSVLNQWDNHSWFLFGSNEFGLGTLLPFLLVRNLLPTVFFGIGIDVFGLFLLAWDLSTIPVHFVSNDCFRVGNDGFGLSLYLCYCT